jgi:hypothetical protein
MIARLEAAVAELDGDHERLCHGHAMLAWMKAGVGFEGVLEHAELSAQEAELARVPTPVYAIAALGTYFITFRGDTARGLEQTRLATDAARAIGAGDLALHFRIVELTYTSLVVPGTDEALQLAELVGREVERSGSVAMRQMWLQATAAALAPVDRERALAMLAEAVELATLAGLWDGVATAQFWRGGVLFAGRNLPAAADAWRRGLVISHDRGNRRGVTNMLSGIVGLVLRTGRTGTAAALLAGLRAARDEFRLRGSAIERQAEQRIEELLRADAGASAVLGGPPLDIEATIDLALATLEEIAAGGQPE